MTTVSNISIGARLAGGAAASARHGMNEAIARLSTGKRSMYGGDAGGQSMANNIKAKGLSYAVAARNAEDGISVAQTMESALMEIASLATRLRELAMQADNEEIMTTADLGALNKEATAVSTAIDAIVTDTMFNETTLLAVGGTSFDIGITDETHVTTIESAQVAATGITTAAAAEDTADTALSEVGKALGAVAAAMSALKGRQAVAYSASANMLAAASRLEETDFAASSANLAKFSILNQSAMAMVAQANQAQSAVLAVLN